MRRRSSVYLSKTSNKSDLQRLQADWHRSCEEAHFFVPKKAMNEIAKRIQRSGSKQDKPKLNFSGCELLDDHVIFLSNALVDSPVVAKLELSDNKLTSKSVKALLNLLIKQYIMTTETPLDNRSQLSLLGEIYVGRQPQPIDEILLNDVELFANALRIENAKARIRNVYTENHSPRVIIAQTLKKIWPEVMGSEDKAAMTQALQQGKIAGNFVLVYEEMENSMLLHMTEKEVIPTITNWGWRRISSVVDEYQRSTQVAPVSQQDSPRDSVDVPSTPPQDANPNPNPNTPLEEPSPREGVDHPIQELHSNQGFHRSPSNTSVSTMSVHSTSAAMDRSQVDQHEAVPESFSAKASENTPVSRAPQSSDVEGGSSSTSTPKRRSSIFSIFSSSKKMTANTSTPSVVNNSPQQQVSQEAQSSPSLNTLSITPQERSASPTRRGSTGNLSGPESPGSHSRSSSVPRGSNTSSPTSPISTSRTRPPPIHTRSPSSASKSPSKSPHGHSQEETPVAPSPKKSPWFQNVTSPEAPFPRPPIPDKSRYADPPEALVKAVNLNGSRLGSSPQLLTAIASAMTGSDAIQSLVLRRNHLSDMEFFKSIEASKLSSLVFLDLGGNQLQGSLDGVPLPKSLLRLDVSHNELTSLDWSVRCINLQVLDAAYNRVKQIGSLPLRIEQLDLTGNLLSNSKEFRLLALCQRLTHIWVRGNPVVEATAGDKQLKVIMRSTFPALKEMDGVAFACSHGSNSSGTSATGNNSKNSNNSNSNSSNSANVSSPDRKKTTRREQAILDKSRCDEYQKKIQALDESRKLIIQEEKGRMVGGQRVLSKEEVVQLTRRLMMHNEASFKRSFSPTRPRLASSSLIHHSLNPVKNQISRGNPKRLSDLGSANDSGSMLLGPVSKQLQHKERFLTPAQVRAVDVLDQWIADCNHELSRAVAALGSAIQLSQGVAWDPELEKVFRNSVKKIPFLTDINVPATIERCVHSLHDYKNIIGTVSDTLEKMVSFASLLQDVDALVESQSSAADVYQLHQALFVLMGTKSGKFVNENILRPLGKAFVRSISVNKAKHEKHNDENINESNVNTTQLNENDNNMNSDAYYANGKNNTDVNEESQFANQYDNAYDNTYDAGYGDQSYVYNGTNDENNNNNLYNDNVYNNNNENNNNNNSYYQQSYDGNDNQPQYDAGYYESQPNDEGYYESDNIGNNGNDNNNDYNAEYDETNYDYTNQEDTTVQRKAVALSQEEVGRTVDGLKQRISNRAMEGTLKVNYGRDGQVLGSADEDGAYEGDGYVDNTYIDGDGIDLGVVDNNDNEGNFGVQVTYEVDNQDAAHSTATRGDNSSTEFDSRPFHPVVEAPSQDITGNMIIESSENAINAASTLVATANSSAPSEGSAASTNENTVEAAPTAPAESGATMKLSTAATVLSARDRLKARLESKKTKS